MAESSNLSRGSTQDLPVSRCDGQAKAILAGLIGCDYGGRGRTRTCDLLRVKQKRRFL